MPAKRKKESVARQSHHAGKSGAVLVELLSAPVVYQQNAKIYPHIYPLGDIAFACVIGYTDSVEVLLISAPQTREITECCHV